MDWLNNKKKEEQVERIERKQKKIARIGILITLALMVSYIEALFPISFFVPGIKLGLANSVVLAALYLLGEKEAFFVSVLRVVLASFLFSGLSMMLYSLVGSLLSFFIMFLAKKRSGLSIFGVSILGGVFHNIGQIIVAILVISSKSLLLYLPVLIVAGIITGGVIGGIAKEILKRMPKEI